MTIRDPPTQTRWRSKPNDDTIPDLQLILNPKPYLSLLSVYLVICSSIYLSIYQSFFLSTCLSQIYGYDGDDDVDDDSDDGDVQNNDRDGDDEYKEDIIHDDSKDRKGIRYRIRRISNR
jgi:hypothetical protein